MIWCYFYSPNQVTNQEQTQDQLFLHNPRTESVTWFSLVLRKELRYDCNSLSNLSVYLSIQISLPPSVCSSMHSFVPNSFPPSIHLSVHPFIHPPIYLSIHSSANPSILSHKSEPNQTTELFKILKYLLSLIYIKKTFERH